MLRYFLYRKFSARCILFLFLAWQFSSILHIAGHNIEAYTPVSFSFNHESPIHSDGECVFLKFLNFNYNNNTAFFSSENLLNTFEFIPQPTDDSYNSYSANSIYNRGSPYIS